MQILFVCTGNTCRSPMAEEIYNKMAHERGVEACAISAGIYAHEGDPATKEARIVIAAHHQGNLTRHRAQILQDHHLDAADLVLTMTAHQRDSLLDIWPEQADKVFTLAEYAIEKSVDIDDPYGLTEEAYAATASQIAALIGKLLDKLFDKDGLFG